MGQFVINYMDEEDLARLSKEGDRAMASLKKRMARAGCRRWWQFWKS